MERTIDICGKRITEYLLQALSWFNRGGERVILRGIGENASRAVQIATILQDDFECEMEDSSVGYFTLDSTKTAYLQITLSWKGESLKTMNYPYPHTKFVDFPIYHFMFDKFLENEKLEIYADKEIVGEIGMTKDKESLYLKREVDDPDSHNYSSLIDAAYRSGFLLPSNWKDITKMLSSYDDVILGIDTNILIYASISEHLIPILNLYNPITYEHTPNWLLFVIPSTVMYEIEEFANVRDREGKIKRLGRKGFRAIQEIIELNESFDLSGLSIMIVGDTDPVLQTKAELKGLRQDLRYVMKSFKEAEHTRFSPKSSSGDIIIRNQFKNFIRKIDFHKGVYFLTADKSNAALADAEGLHSIYLKFPAQEFGSSKRYLEIKIGENPSVKLDVPVGKILYELAVEFGEIQVNTEDMRINLSVDLLGERIDHWINRRLKINEYDYKRLAYEDGYVDMSQVMKIWREIMRSEE